jgi:hypothetical protein
MSSGFLAWEKASSGVEVPVIEMLGNLGAESVGFGI